MADFPQYDWKILDNTTIPFTKPQHYKKGSTTEVELTGHDNPLPVANYTQNDSGMWMPVSKSNPVPTQVTGSNVELISRVSKFINARFFVAGETTGSGHQDYRLLDISDYRQVSVLIQNKTSENINYLELHYNNEASGASPLKERLRLHHDGADITLDAG